MTKKDRLKLIIELIEKEEIGTQEELTDRLLALKYDVSQATVSRDIKELNLLKVEGVKKKFKYIQAKAGNKEVPEQIISLFNQITLSIENANNLIVVKTLSGNAGSAGMAIDAMHFPSVLGTVAGDDTLLIIAKTNLDAEIIVKTLRNL